MAPSAVTPPNHNETVTDLTQAGIKSALLKNAPEQINSASLTNSITATPPNESAHVDQPLERASARSEIIRRPSPTPANS